MVRLNSHHDPIRPSLNLINVPFYPSTLINRWPQHRTELGTRGRRLLPPHPQQHTRHHVCHLAGVLHRRLWLEQLLRRAHSLQADRDPQRRTESDGSVRRYLWVLVWRCPRVAPKTRGGAVGVFHLASDVRWCRRGVVRPKPDHPARPPVVGPFMYVRQRTHILFTRSPVRSLSFFRWCIQRTLGGYSPTIYDLFFFFCGQGQHIMHDVIPRSDYSLHSSYTHTRCSRRYTVLGNSPCQTPPHS